MSGRFLPVEMRMNHSEYFSRMVKMPEIGAEGLMDLRSAQVTIVGVGGVGSAAAFYLSKMGVGHLRLIDQDIVEPSNLHRLHGASRDDLYHSKAEVVAETLSKFSPSLEIQPIVDTLRTSNFDALLSGSDLVVDGLDNFRSRYLLNKYSRAMKTPYLFTSAIANQGHLALFSPPETACLSCIMPNVVDRPEESCESLGITPTTVALVGAFAADFASKMLIGAWTKLAGRLVTIDTAGLEFIVNPIPKRVGCETCDDSSPPTRRESEILVELCGGKTFNVLPEKPLLMDLHHVSLSVPRERLLGVSENVLVYRKAELILSLFRTGRLLVEGVEGRDDALLVARSVWQELEKEPPTTR